MVEKQNPLWLSLCKYIDPNEEHLIDSEGDISDIILFVSDINQLKERVLLESRVGQEEFNICELNLVFFFPQVHNSPKFITWCVQYYLDYNKFIMFEEGSTVIFVVNTEAILKMLKLSNPKNHCQVSLNKENLDMSFHQLSLESNYEQLKIFLKQGQSIE